MKRINILLFTVYFSAICIQQHTAAQPVPVPGGEYYRQEGIASWYGYEFDGRPTASGEIFNSALFTAAHPVLPFGTILMVTNRQNNRQIAVKVNDRGPFVASRIVDLSRAAAEQLDMLITGTAPVIIEKIPPNHPLYASAPSVPPPFQMPPAFLPPPQQQPGYFPQQPVPQQAPQPPLPPQVLPPPPPGYFPPQVLAPPPGYLPPQTLPPQSFQPPPGYLPIQPTAPTVITQPMLPPSQRLPSLPPQPIQTPILIPTPPPGPPPETPPPPPPPPPAAAAPSINVTVYPPPTPPTVTPTQDLPRARLSPPTNPLPDRIYKLQVGSYKIAGNAVDAYVKLKAAGLTPSYERNGDFFRVVVAGICGTDVVSVAEKLATAGFREAFIREEK